MDLDGFGFGSVCPGLGWVFSEFEFWMGLGRAELVYVCVFGGFFYMRMFMLCFSSGSLIWFRHPDHFFC